MSDLSSALIKIPLYQIKAHLIEDGLSSESISSLSRSKLVDRLIRDPTWVCRYKQCHP